MRLATQVHFGNFVHFQEIQGEEQSRIKHQERKAAEDFGTSRWGKIRKFMWNLTEYPETSIAAQVSKKL